MSARHPPSREHLLTRIADLKAERDRLLADVETAGERARRPRVEPPFRLMASSLPQIVWTTDAVGRPEFLNRQWVRYTGTARRPTSALDFVTRFLHPDDVASTREAWRTAFRGGGTFRAEQRIRSATGAYRWFLSLAEPYRAPETGAIVRWFGTSTDIHDQKRTARALRESESKYRSLFESIDEGFCIVEVTFQREVPVDCRFVEINPAFERHTGLANALGRTVRELVPDIEPFWLDSIGRVALTGEPNRFMDRAASLGRWFDVYAFRIGEPEEHRVAVLFSDVTARKRSEEELLEAKRAAESANQAKTRFLAVMSHELRTPLTGVIGCADLMESEILGPVADGQRDAIARIKTNSWHLVEIIEEVLGLARAEAGKEEVRWADVDLAEIAHEAGRVLQPEADRQGLALRLVNADTPRPLRTDEGKVKRILLNLVGNAVKYTDQGEVTIEVEPEEAGSTNSENVRVHVRDTGPGIAPEDQERIFETFTQVDSSHTRRGEGTGLGLTISRRLARLLQGDVTLRSELGTGSTFTLHLPREPAAKR